MEGESQVQASIVEQLSSTVPALSRQLNQRRIVQKKSNRTKSGSESTLS
jgi:hypothetical protein